MNKDRLIELASNPDFISGIYNYCDRWCERCSFASRCFLYATEQADPDFDDPEVRDITNEKFWNKLRSIFQSTAEMLSEWAAEAGIDLESIDSDAEIVAHRREIEEIEQMELSQAASKYATSVEHWFRAEFAAEDIVYDDTTGKSRSYEMDLTVSDAVDVIRWYQLFIAVKLMRALSGGDRVGDEDFDDADEFLSFDFTSPTEEDDEDVDYDAVIARASRLDSNGSAKIALVAIDRSIAAWRALQISLPEKADTIKPLLIGLDRLRRSTEARFPRARDFIRPGFDENLSESVS
jgi:hypothetical protein